MLENLSQPVAFATIPLTSSSPEESSNLTQQDDGASISQENGVTVENGHQTPQTLSEDEQKKLEDQLSLALEEEAELLSGNTITYSHIAHADPKHRIWNG